MIGTETRTYKLGPRKGLREFPLEVSPEFLFMPNAVTRIMARSTEINAGDVVFDVGSGTGPLAIWAGLEPSSEVHAIEIVEAQYEILRRNIRENRLDHKIHAYHGPFFDPIPPKLKANVIIADVSGVSEGPARALGWYPDDIPTGGEDGTEVIVPLLERAGPYLSEGGRLYFPLGVGLSNSERTMGVANDKFRTLKLLDEHDFPLDDGQVEAMRPYLNLSYIRLDNLQSEEKRTTWKAEFYEATNPR